MGAAARAGVLRCVTSGALPPALNMGLDEALLLGTGPPTLRLYGWSPPGLSLGYFQRSAGFEDLEGPHVLVRRLTGGGAIYHDRELTFALTADLDLLPASVPASYELVHAALRRALGAAGLDVRSARGAPGGTRPRPAEPWCLLAPGPCDLVDAGGRKVLGSAQRRIRSPRPRVLHHGSLVLEAPAATPACGSLGEAADREAIGRAVSTELAAALGLRAETGELDAAETARGAELAEGRYSDERFTHRR